MKWILVVFVLWHGQPVKQWEFEMSSEQACHDAMFAVEQKLLSDSMISKHDGYTLTCREQE